MSDGGSDQEAVRKILEEARMALRQAARAVDRQLGGESETGVRQQPRRRRVQVGRQQAESHAEELESLGLEAPYPGEEEPGISVNLGCIDLACKSS